MGTLLFYESMLICPPDLKGLKLHYYFSIVNWPLVGYCVKSVRAHISYLCVGIRQPEVQWIMKSTREEGN